MIVSLIPIGNSKGIRLPKTVLKDCQIENQLELKVENQEIILKPVKKKVREGWKAAFSKMHRQGDDQSIIKDESSAPSFDWEW